MHYSTQRNCTLYTLNTQLTYYIIRKELERNEDAIRKRNVACKCENDTKRNVSERNRNETLLLNFSPEYNNNNNYV